MTKASAVAKAKKKLKKAGEKEGKPEKVESETAASQLVRAHWFRCQYRSFRLPLFNLIDKGHFFYNRAHTSLQFPTHFRFPIHKDLSYQ